MIVETTFHLLASGRVADVASWTQQLGLAPSASAVKGERAGSAPSPDSWWAYSSDKRAAETAEGPLLDLLGRLAPFRSQIKALASSEELEVSVTSYVWDTVQGLAVDLQPSTVALLAELGCAYAVVVYE
jgi:hypothetical protein